MSRGLFVVVVVVVFFSLAWVAHNVLLRRTSKIYHHLFIYLFIYLFTSNAYPSKPKTDGVDPVLLIKRG